MSRGDPAVWDEDRPSPNADRRTAPPSVLVLHYTGMPTAAEALERLCDPAAKVSAHYLVDEDGRIVRLVPEERRAWHAGVSAWRGRTGLNDASIGVEIVNPGHAWGYRPFPEAQIRRVLELVADVRGRWSIEDWDIIGHSDVAPERKEDPGELFPWERLAAEGHGIWTEPHAAPGPPLAEGDEGLGVFVLQGGLQSLGYALERTGKFDAPTAAVVRAFQRHWRQTRVDGVADGETRGTLTRLLRLCREG